MNDRELHIVTDAYGFSGKYIASRLLQQGYRVATLTNSLDRENSFGGKIEAHPYHFDDPEALAESLKGARVLYNTYWVMRNLLYTSSAPAGKTRFTDWAQDHADALGQHYAGELARRRDRTAAYKNL